MQSSMIIEIVGYIGSFLVLVSFLMTSVYKLRVVNTVGSVIFMIYALIIHSYPTAIMNFCLVLINLRFLWKMSKSDKAYKLVPVDPGDSYFKHLLSTYDEDIRACFPGIDHDPDNADVAYIIDCSNKAAGFFMASGDMKDLDIKLDYSTPEYRDFSLGKYLMEELKKLGVRTLRYTGPTDHHTEYLEKMGFEKTENGYIKVLG